MKPSIERNIFPSSVESITTPDSLLNQISFHFLSQWKRKRKTKKFVMCLAGTRAKRELPAFSGFIWSFSPLVIGLRFSTNEITVVRGVVFPTIFAYEFVFL